ncbi:hypothetical protein AAVH_16648 [Aphelenchoides avenae]|nr:hypothetical protein AAVH_16648 [Aphelenchus avenae]
MSAHCAHLESESESWDSRSTSRTFIVRTSSLRAKCVHDPDRVYTIVRVFRASPPKYDVIDKLGVYVKNLFEAKCSATLDYIHMPYVVAVDSPDGRREFLSMECVRVLLSPGVKKLVLVSILAARQANASTIRYGRS